MCRGHYALLVSVSMQLLHKQGPPTLPHLSTPSLLPACLMVGRGHSDTYLPLVERALVKHVQRTLCPERHHDAVPGEFSPTHGHFPFSGP